MRSVENDCCYCFGLLWSVDADGFIISDDYFDIGAILQCAQLFELFCQFQRRGFPADKLEKKFSRESVDAFVP